MEPALEASPPPAPAGPGGWASRCRRFLGQCWWVGALLLLGVALLVGVARLALPQLHRLQEPLTAWAAQALGRPVAVGRLHAALHGLTPTLRMEEVTVLEGPGGEPWLRMEEAHVELDLWASLRALRPLPGTVVLEGLTLRLARDGSGRLYVGAPGAGGGLEAWLLGLRRLELRRARILWREGREELELRLHRLALARETIREQVMALPAGTMVAWHPKWRQPLLLRFPRPLHVLHKAAEERLKVRGES